jgi:chromosome segregation ATPase
MDKKMSELEASNARKDKRIVSLEAKLKRAKEEYEAKTNNIRQASAEAVVNLSIVQVKIGDLNDEINHIRRLNKTIGF